MIYNICLECGHSIKIKEPFSIESKIILLTRVIICNVCSRKSKWVRCSTAEMVKNARYTFTELSKDEITELFIKR